MSFNKILDKNIFIYDIAHWLQ